MTATEFQQWLVAHGQLIDVDGKPGQKTRDAIIAAFTNLAAAKVTDDDITALALRLGCTPKQIRAVAQVESGGSAFDKQGRPKILFERHFFWRITDGTYGVTPYSNLHSGGYDESSWTKLVNAACKDSQAAFASCSWGKFQVMGAHWKTLGYDSALDMAYTTVNSEAAHYEMLARYIEYNNLKKALQALSKNAIDNVAFARAYNGQNYKKFAYDTKLAEAMK